MQTAEQLDDLQTIAPDDYDRARGKPTSNITHGVIQLQLGSQCIAQSKDKFRIVRELTLEFADGLVLTPDLAVLSKRQLRWGLEPTRCKEIPLLVVEIYSPTQGYLEIMEKRELYFAHGVKAFWAVQPSTQAIEIFSPGNLRPQIVQQGEAKDGSTGLVARLEEVFS